LSECRIDLDRLGIVGDDAIVIDFKLVKRVAAIKVVDCARPDLQSFVVIGKSVVEIAPGAIGVGTIAVSFGIFGVEPDRVGIVGDGALVIALSGVFYAPVVILDGEIAVMQTA
jgi:hypothetical protein